jgi:hypothetical protein
MYKKGLTGEVMAKMIKRPMSVKIRAVGSNHQFLLINKYLISSRHI